MEDRLPSRHPAVDAAPLQGSSSDEGDVPAMDSAGLTDPEYLTGTGGEMAPNSQIPVLQPRTYVEYVEYVTVTRQPSRN